MAERLFKHDAPSIEDRVRYGLKLGALPEHAQTVDILVRGYHDHLATYQSDPAAAAALLRNGESPIAPGLDHGELAAMTLTCSTILNLDRLITRE